MPDAITCAQFAHSNLILPINMYLQQFLLLLLTDYLQPLAAAVHTLDPGLIAMASPYNIGSGSRVPAGLSLTPSLPTSLTRSSPHSLTQAPTHLPKHPLTYPSTHSPSYSWCAGDRLTPQLYAELWAEVFSVWAPDFDLLAPQVTRP